MKTVIWAVRTLFMLVVVIALELIFCIVMAILIIGAIGAILYPITYAYLTWRLCDGVARFETLRKDAEGLVLLILPFRWVGYLWNTGNIYWKRVPNRKGAFAELHQKYWPATAVAAKGRALENV